MSVELIAMMRAAINPKRGWFYGITPERRSDPTGPCEWVANANGELFGGVAKSRAEAVEAVYTIALLTGNVTATMAHHVESTR